MEMRMPNSFLPAALTLALSACSLGVVPVQPGQTEAEVRAAFGTPTGSYPLAGGGQRLEYSRQPYGRVTYMVDLDPTGRVTAVNQVMQPRYFAQVTDGMPRDDLLRLLGHPAERAAEWQNRETWSWRYPTNDCLWFRVTLSADQKVIHGGSQMTDPRCDARSDNARD
jgi:hypothetical protein